MSATEARATEQRVENATPPEQDLCLSSRNACEVVCHLTFTCQSALSYGAALSLSSEGDE